MSRHCSRSARITVTWPSGISRFVHADGPPGFGTTGDDFVIDAWARWFWGPRADRGSD
jgi:hypothetical protein